VRDGSAVRYPGHLQTPGLPDAREPRLWHHPARRADALDVFILVDASAVRRMATRSATSANDGLDFRSAVAALAPPARPWIDGKAVVTDEAGKVRYQPLITFSTHGCRSRWSDAVLDAVREAFPDALADTTDEPALAFPDDAP
jgi:hypothetical protein